MPKTLTAPYIQCRADEIGSSVFEVELNGKFISVRAYSREDAEEIAEETENADEIEALKSDLTDAESQVERIKVRLEQLGVNTY